MDVPRTDLHERRHLQATAGRKQEIQLDGEDLEEDHEERLRLPQRKRPPTIQQSDAFHLLISPIDSDHVRRQKTPRKPEGLQPPVGDSSEGTVRLPGN